MPTATLDRPEATPRTLPTLNTCHWCGGAAVEPEAEGVPCLVCDGSGYAGVWYGLGPSRSAASRCLDYRPGVRRLVLTVGKKVTQYAVREFVPEPGYAGRAFELEKLNDPDGRVHHIETGPGFTRCDCEGSTYASAAKANQRAHEEGRETYRTAGCVHADAVRKLLDLGWFDVNDK